MLKKKQGVGQIRYVTLMKGENEGLGISITVSFLHISKFFVLYVLYVIIICTSMLYVESSNFTLVQQNRIVKF